MDKGSRRERYIWQYCFGFIFARWRRVSLFHAYELWAIYWIDWDDSSYCFQNGPSDEKSDMPRTKTCINLKISCNYREFSLIEVPISDQWKSHFLYYWWSLQSSYNSACWNLLKISIMLWGLEKYWKNFQGEMEFPSLHKCRWWQTYWDYWVWYEVAVYKGTNSIVLLVVAGSNYEVTWADVGMSGRISDDSLLKRSGQMQEEGSLNLRARETLPGRSVPAPHVFVGRSVPRPYVFIGRSVPTPYLFIVDQSRHPMRLMGDQSRHSMCSLVDQSRHPTCLLVG